MSDTTTALSLMRKALALLDNAGACTSACHLQAAIDAAEGRGPMKAGDTISADDELRYLGPVGD